MKPTCKSAAIENLLTAMNGMSRQEGMKKGICVICNGYVTGFKDALSAQEYRISGMCQKCQDSVFVNFGE